MKLERVRGFWINKIVPGIIYLLVLCMLLGVFRLFGFDYTFALSNSMEPTLKVNALILTYKTPFNEIKEGDIVANDTEQYDKWVVHRVYDVKVSGGQNLALMTKGDNNDVADLQGATEDTYRFKVIGYTNIFVPIITIFFGTLTSFKIRLLKVLVATVFILLTGTIAGKQFWILINHLLKGVKQYDNREFTKRCLYDDRA